MRHTLLPQSEKKLLHKEYYIRLIIVASCMFAAIMIAGSILLMPAYLRARVEEQTQLNAISELKRGKNTDELTAIESELSRDALSLALLLEPYHSERASLAIQRIVELRKDIRLTGLAYQVLSSTTAGLVIQGLAPTRNSLLTFQERIEAMIPETIVELPISELAKSTNIPFSLKVVYPMPSK